VSKWVSRHDFLGYIGNNPGLKRAKAKEIVRGLRYLHEQGIIHGDLKADNVIVSDQGVAQITDFGIAQILGITGFTTTTPRNIRFTAPELMPIDVNPEQVSVTAVRPTYQSDVFSLGMLLLQLFHGPDQNTQRRLPYNHVRFIPVYDVGLVIRIHRGDRPRRERYNYVEDRHWSLICWCWAGNPDERPSVSQVLHEL